MNRQTAYLFLTFAVLTTTVFSWFRVNSLCVIALAAFSLWDNKPVHAVRSALTNKYVLAYLAFFLIETISLLYTHNKTEGAGIVSKDASLVAIAFVLCADRWIDEKGYRQLMTGYCCILVAASVFCLGMAAGAYEKTGDPDVFFYHTLTSPISQNAVFYSVYILFGALYLLSPGARLVVPARLAGMRRTLHILLVVFFGGMILLLSSKLILIIFLVLLVFAMVRNVHIRRRGRLIAGLSVAGIALAGLLMLTDNPIRSRFGEMKAGDLDMIKSEQFTPGTAFKPLQLRLLEWHFALEILNEHHAWLFGVSPGDSQDLLNQKYITANMYIGNPADGPHRKIRGFIGYNFHNQYIETLVRDGIIGLTSLLLIFWLLGGIVREWRTRQALFTVVTLAVFFIPEAPLTMQHGIFLFCFFPLLLLHSPKRV